MPMPKNLIPKKQLKVYVPEDLYAQIQLLLFDPITESTRRGALSALVESLLRSWLREQQELANGRETSKSS